MNLPTYLPQDRRLALAQGVSLPDRAHGSVLFADISGFTPLTEQLRQTLGTRRGAEELARRLDAAYTALIAQVERYGGSVIGFAGDAITCWFDDNDAPAAARATACGLALHQVIQPFHAPLSDQNAPLNLKVVVATGPARRFVVGQPEYHYLDILAGATVTRMDTAQRLAAKKETLLDEATVAAIGDSVILREWRTDPEDARVRFGVVDQFTAVVADAAPPETTTADPDLWRSWLLDSVYQRERVGQIPFLTEFRPCAALFVRFAGIDYDADNAQARLDQFASQMQAAAARYEGALLHLVMGDKGNYAYLNFGALSVHEDDPRRAVAAALALQEAAQELPWLEPLQIGVAYGVMWVGAYGGPTRRTYSALGDAVNLAARLMQTAAPGEILISAAVHTAVADPYVCQPNPLLAVKGKAEPLVVFAVTGERRRQPIRLQEPVYALPMVGRQAELQLIKEKLASTAQGQSQILGVIAEAGLGKSRLVAELIGAARRRGFAGYGGACQSDGLHTPYLAWKPIWNAFFNLDPTAPLAEQTRLLTAEIERLAPERLSALPLLSPLLNLTIPDNEFTRSLEPKERKSALHALLEDCLKAAAQQSPLLIVIEDLHWIDALSHDLLDELARATAAWPICFALAYRPPQLARLQAPRLEALPNFTRIKLEQLNDADAAALIQVKLNQLYPARDGVAPPQLVENLLTRAQGNPFYLEELLNFLRDRRLDPGDPASLAQIELPDSLHTLILSRIDQLTEREKNTLHAASVIGRLFRADWLVGYYPKLGDFTQVKVDLDQLRILDITPLDRPEPELAYLFKHIVTHEATYESLPFAARARLHERLGDYLVEASDPASLLPIIAHHYGQSDNAAKKRDYFRQAGDAAQTAFANEAALDYFSRLLTLLDEPRARLELRQKEGAVLELMGRYDEAETAVSAALTIAVQIDGQADIARCRYVLGKLSLLRGNYDAARQELESGLALAQQLGQEQVVAESLRELGLAAYEQGDYETARSFYEQSLALCQEADNKRGVAAASARLASVFYSQGDYPTARALYEQALVLAQETGDKWTASFALNHLGIVAERSGDFAAARNWYEQGLTLSREIGGKLGVASASNNLGIASQKMGDSAAAQVWHEQSLALYREMGNKRGLTSTLNNLGIMAHERGDYETAQALYEETLALCREMGNKWGVALGLINLGNLTIERADAATANRCYREGLALCQEMNDRNNLFYLFSGLAAVAALTADLSRAARLAAVAETLRLEIGAVWEPAEGRIYENTLAAARAGLDATTFQSAWMEGERMTVTEAAAYVG